MGFLLADIGLVYWVEFKVGIGFFSLVELAFVEYLINRDLSPTGSSDISRRILSRLKFLPQGVDKSNEGLWG
jgi:hypothetical protein